MKKISIIFNLILIVILTSCNKNVIQDELNTYEQVITDEEAIYVDNPDQGFYSPVCIQVKDDFKDKDYVINDKTRLYHLRMDLSEFSSKYNNLEDKVLGDADLENIDKMLFKYLVKEKNVIIRFAYDHNYEGKKDQEPSISMIETHIKQLAPILNKYEDCITAIEAGMIGPWGEMHSSACANKETINIVIDAFLKNVNNIPILVRTPKMIYNYLKIDINDISSYRVDKDNIGYRLGIFNDGYLGSSSDLGTYSNRELEINWLAKQTNHLPYGGEVVVPSSTLHDIDKCLFEMNLMHLSYLNQAWNDEVIKKWKSTKYNKNCGNDSIFYGVSAYDYINAHLGYRFVLKKSIISYNDNDIFLNLEIENKGFGNLLRNKKIEVYVCYDDESIEKYDQCLKTNNIEKLSLSIPNNGKCGKVYLSIKNDNDAYPIKLANKDIYDDNLKANLIGIIQN